MLKETFRGIWVVAFREILHFTSDKTRIFSSLMFPLMFLSMQANLQGRGPALQTLMQNWKIIDARTVAKLENH